VGVSVLTAACGNGGRSGTQTSVDSTAAAAATDIVGPDRPIDLGSPANIPELDPTTMLVDPSSIVYDTFDGGSVSLTDADPGVVRGLIDAISPIDAPDYESSFEGQWLSPEDLIVGFLDSDGSAWAFPVRVLNFHEIVNDQFAGVPVLVSYCPLCGSGVVFDRRVGNRLLSFSNTSALHENDLVMVDRETGSYWWQVPGRALGGPLAGSELTALASETTTWTRWLAAHPATRVMMRPAGRTYDRDPFVGYQDLVNEGVTPFPVESGALADGRLPAGERVLVATINGETRAWPTSPARTVEDSVGGIDVVVTTDGIGGSGVDPGGVRLATRSSFWFAIVAAFPEVTVGP